MAWTEQNTVRCFVSVWGFVSGLRVPNFRCPPKTPKIRNRIFGGYFSGMFEVFFRSPGAGEIRISRWNLWASFWGFFGGFYSQKYASDPRSPHARQKYEQTSGQNMAPNASKQGKFGSLGRPYFRSYFCLVCGGWAFKKNPLGPAKTYKLGLS